MSVFNYLNYIDVLHWQIESHGETFRYKTLLSEAAGCQPSFLSQVLARKVHLSSDHGIGLCHFWQFSELEEEYFIELIHLARAGNKRLREFTQKRLKKIKSESENFSSRFKKEVFTTDIAQAAVYYSAWYYTAIHILITLPEFQTPESIGERLGLPLQTIKNALNILLQMGLVEEKTGRWNSKNSNVHLSKDSPLSTLHHHHWREKSITAYSERQKSIIAYSSLYSLSRSDFEILKNMILEFIDKTRKLVDSSVSEELICFVCDLFTV